MLNFPERRDRKSFVPAYESSAIDRQPLSEALRQIDILRHARRRNG